MWNFFVCPKLNWMCLFFYQLFTIYYKAVNTLTLLFQCNSGHSLCVSCRIKSGKNCRTCEKSTVSKRNKALQSIMTQAKFQCVNGESGCTELSSCHDKAKHESKCLYLLIFCPESGCNFRWSTGRLPRHLAVIHNHSIMKFHYDQIVRVFVFNVSKMEPLLAEDGTVFLLQNCHEACGYILSVVCIRSPVWTNQISCVSWKLGRAPKKALKIVTLSWGWKWYG